MTAARAHRSFISSLNPCTQTLMINAARWTFGWWIKCNVINCKSDERLIGYTAKVAPTAKLNAKTHFLLLSPVKLKDNVCVQVCLCAWLKLFNTPSNDSSCSIQVFQTHLEQTNRQSMKHLMMLTRRSYRKCFSVSEAQRDCTRVF